MNTLPRKPGESFTDYILRWLTDAERRRIRELDRRVEAARERDANHYCVFDPEL